MPENNCVNVLLTLVGGALGGLLGTWLVVVFLDKPLYNLAKWMHGRKEVKK